VRASAVCVLVLLVGVLGNARTAATQRDHIDYGPRPSPEDSAAAWFEGFYHPANDPRRTIEIRYYGAGILRVTSSRDWESVGVLVDGVYRGVLITPARTSPQWTARKQGLLSIAPDSGRSLRAEILPGPGLTWRIEAWAYDESDSLLEGLVPQLEDPAEDALPKYGDYVYVENLPVPVLKVPAVYSKAMRDGGLEGLVMLQALVGRDGRVKDTRVTKSVPGLDEAAIAAVLQWRFKPAVAARRAVAVWVSVPVRFTLH